LAQVRSADQVRKCLLCGVDRKYRRQVLNDANDPEATQLMLRCYCLEIVGGLLHPPVDTVAELGESLAKVTALLLLWLWHKVLSLEERPTHV
jgi:hypothetical protein